MSSLEKITGKVASKLTKKGVFRLKTLDDERMLSITYPYTYSPFKPGDVLSCYCFPTDDASIYKFESILKIELGQDQNTFLSLLVRALPGGGFAGKAANALYDYLVNLLKTDTYKSYETIGDLMSYFSEAALKSPDEVPQTVQVLCAAKMMVMGKRKSILTPDKALQLLEWWSENFDMRRLYCLGLTFDEIDNAEMTPYKLYQQICINPYAVPSIALEKCPELDLKLHRPRNVYDADCGKLIRDLYENTKRRGWSCTPFPWLERRLGASLSKEMREILTNEFRVVFVDVPIYNEEDDKGPGTTQVFEERVYLKQFYKAEKIVRDFILRMVRSPPISKLADPIFSDEALDEYQRSAVTMALKENISIICGPAGSGKTRTLRTIIENLELQQESEDDATVVTSFTGKAVIRARQLNGIGQNAATIHRILCGRGPQQFGTVIWEESSMNATPLVAKFIKKFEKRQYRCIFVGDPNQLPPIEWGFLFGAMINSRSIPKVELKSIHRVKTKDGKEDGIIQNTTKMCTWPEGVDFQYKKTENFQVIQGGPNEVFDLVEKLKAEGRDCKEITILSPYKERTIDGKKYDHLSKINQICQLIWNRTHASTTGPELDPRKWFVGDRVMVNKNVYEGIDIFNGQEGYVTNVSKTGVDVCFEMDVIERIYARESEKPEEVTTSTLVPTNDAVTLNVVKEVQLDPRHRRISYNKIVSIPFPSKEMKKKRKLRIHGHNTDEGGALSTKLIDLSYAMTVHKSQGSEWPFVIVITPSDAPTGGGFFNRNLCYTADTRASEHLVLVDQLSKSCVAIGHPLPYRCESLTNFLKHELDRLHNYVAKVIEEVDAGCCEDLDFDDFDF